MNALFLLMGLLVLSFAGNLLVRGRVGFPSGVEYVALGFLLGPHVLGLVDRSTLESFAPIVQVSLGWLALVIGIDFGFAGDRRIGPKSLVLGLLSALLTGGAVAGVALLILWWRPVVSTSRDVWLLAGGLGAAGAETTRHAVRWVAERHNGKGKLSDFLNEMSHAGHVVPLLVVTVLFAITQKQTHIPQQIHLWGWVLLTIGLGFVLGAVAALLLGDEFTLHTTWGVLLGTSMLAIGTAARLDLSYLSTTFFMGIALAAVSPHHGRVRDAVAPTERAVLLPALLLAGARIDLTVLRLPYVPLVVGATILARILGKVVSGWFVRGTSAGKNAGAGVGLALLSSGALAIAIGLAFAMRFPGKVGDTVLLTSALSALLGEFVAPASLRRVLGQAGELPPAPSVAAVEDP